MDAESKFRSAATVLGRLVTYDPNKGTHLHHLLLSNPALGGAVGTQLAQELGLSVSSVVESLASYDYSDQLFSAAFRRAIYPHLPWPTIVLRKTAASVLQQVVDDVRNNAQREYSRYELAQALIAWGTWLGEAGQSRQAYEAEEEAARMLEHSSSREESLLMHSAITNMLIHARRLGESTLERLAIDRASQTLQVVDGQETDGSPEFSAGVRRILMNAAWSKFNLGQLDEAVQDSQRAIELYVNMQFLGEVAEYVSVLINHSTYLSFQPGQELAALEIAEQGLQMARDLVEAEPTAYSSHLALSLMNCAERYYGKEDLLRAKEYATEAAKLHGKLADLENPIDRAQHADSLVNLASIEIATEQIDIAVPILKKALDIYSSIQAREPNMWRGEAGTAHLTLSNAFLSASQFDNSLIQIGFAISLLSRAIESGETIWLPQLTIAWLQKAFLSKRIGDKSATAAAHEKGIELNSEHRELIERRGQRFLERVDFLLRDLKSE